MQTILAATDLSPRSDRALHRAALLARQFRARLMLLHVVDNDQPPAMVAYDRQQATAFLDGQAAHLGDITGSRPKVLVDVGAPFETIVRTALDHDADLIVMGAHRRRLLRDILVGTTIERVIRTGTTPVLMVNTYPNDPYRRVLCAADLSAESAQAIRAARTLGLSGSAAVSIVHAFRPYAKAMLSRVGATHEAVSSHLAQTAFDAAGDLADFLEREGIRDDRHEIVLEEGDPFAVIMEAARRDSTDLLVIGTRKEKALKRVLLGSVAEHILREAECDVLAVPPAQACAPTGRAPQGEATRARALPEPQGA